MHAARKVGSVEHRPRLQRGQSVERRRLWHGVHCATSTRHSCVNWTTKAHVLVGVCACLGQQHMHTPRVPRRRRCRCTRAEVVRASWRPCADYAVMHAGPSVCHDQPKRPSRAKLKDLPRQLLEDVDVAWALVDEVAWHTPRGRLQRQAVRHHIVVKRRQCACDHDK